MTRAIYGVICSTMLLSLLLSFLAFADYRDGVVAVSMPDYEITLDYALQVRELGAFEKELKTTGEFAEIQHLIGRGSGQLTAVLEWTDPLYKETKDQVPPTFMEKLFTTDKDSEKYPTYFKPGARKVNVYGISSGSSLFQALNGTLGGLLDTEAFQSGRGAIMLYPSWLKLKESKALDPDLLAGIPRPELLKTIFETQGTIRLSYNFREAPLLEKLNEETIPRQIQLTFNSEENTETERNVDPPSVFNVELMSVVSALPEFGAWPYSLTLEHPVILGSHSLVRSMIANTRSAEQLVGTPPSQTLVPTLYGNQQTALWAGADKTDGQFVRIQQIASRYGGRARNLYADKLLWFNAALRISTIVLILAFLIGLTALQIQLNISKARVETERVFIGTLQSLGVSGNRLKLAYIRSGMGYSLAGIFFTHILLALVLLMDLVQRYPMQLLGKNFLHLVQAELWLYPWWDHLGVTILFFILGTLIYYVPLQQVLKIHPINNIRGL